MSSSSTGNISPRPATPLWQTITSFVIFVHLFFVFVALSANHVRSGLTGTILSRFAFYTRLLNFDLNFVPYHLTHGTDVDVDHRIEVLPRDQTEWKRLPEGGMRGHDSYQRFQRFAAEWAYQALNDGEPALFAQSVGTYYSRRLDVAPKQIRCRKQFQQSREDMASASPARRDPDDPSRFSVAYAANAIVNEDGSVDIVRIEEAGQVAAPVNSAGGQRGTNVHERNR